MNQTPTFKNILIKVAPAKETWEEEKHPRDDKGEFTSKGRGATRGARAGMARMSRYGEKKPEKHEPEPEEPKIEKPKPAPAPAVIEPAVVEPAAETPAVGRRVPVRTKAKKADELPESHWTKSSVKEDWNDSTIADAKKGSRFSSLVWKITGPNEMTGTMRGMDGEFRTAKVDEGGRDPVVKAAYFKDGKRYSDIVSADTLFDAHKQVLEGAEKPKVETALRPSDPSVGWLKEPVSYYGKKGNNLDYATAKKFLDSMGSGSFKTSRDRPDETVFTFRGGRDTRAHIKMWNFQDTDGSTKVYARYFTEGEPVGKEYVADTKEDAVNQIKNDFAKFEIAHRPKEDTGPKPTWMDTGVGKKFAGDAGAASHALEGAEELLKSGDIAARLSRDWDASSSFSKFHSVITAPHSDASFSGTSAFKVHSYWDGEEKKYAMRYYEDGDPIGPTAISDSPEGALKEIVDSIKDDVAKKRYKIVTKEDRAAAEKERVAAAKRAMKDITSAKEPLFKPSPANYKRATDYAENSITGAASSHGVSATVVKNKVMKMITDHVSSNPVSKRIWGKDLAKVLGDPEIRFKTQFETGSSDGLYSPTTRANAEYKGLGVPTRVEPRLRPVYGYVHFDGDSPGNYGDIEVVFNENVKNRTTFTIDDSLGRFGDGRVIGTPILKPEIGSVDGEFDNLYRAGGFKRSTYVSYIECQIHGGVTLHESESIVFHSGCFDSSGRTLKSDYAAYERKLKALGIKVIYDPSHS